MPLTHPGIDFTYRVRFLTATSTLVLAVQDSSTLIIESCGITQVQQARDLERAPGVDGDFEVESTAQATAYGLSVICLGASFAAATATCRSIRDASQQRGRWYLDTYEQGATALFAANAADYDMGVDDDLARNGARRIRLVIPVQPNPTEA